MQSQLEDEACPLVGRVGAFAGALRMKKSWHGREMEAGALTENSKVYYSLTLHTTKPNMGPAKSVGGLLQEPLRLYSPLALPFLALPFLLASYRRACCGRRALAWCGLLHAVCVCRTVAKTKQRNHLDPMQFLHGVFFAAGGLVLNGEMVRL